MSREYDLDEMKERYAKKRKHNAGQMYRKWKRCKGVGCMNHVAGYSADYMNGGYCEHCRNRRRRVPYMARSGWSINHFGARHTRNQHVMESIRSLFGRVPHVPTALISAIMSYMYAKRR